MNILYPAGAKREWFDRNIVIVMKESSLTGTAPHGSTERWRYTVPAGKRAFVAAANLLVTRITAAAPVGQVLAWFGIYDGAASFNLAFAELFNNAIGAQCNTVLPNFGWLTAGQQLYAYTNDLSTGGTTNIYQSAQIIAFDA